MLGSSFQVRTTRSSKVFVTATEQSALYNERCSPSPNTAEQNANPLAGLSVLGAVPDSGLSPYTSDVTSEEESKNSTNVQLTERDLLNEPDFI